MFSLFLAKLSNKAPKNSGVAALFHHDFPKTGPAEAKLLTEHGSAFIT